MPKSTKEQLEQEIADLKKVERRIKARGLYGEAQKLREAIDGLIVKLGAISCAR